MKEREREAQLTLSDLENLKAQAEERIANIRKAVGPVEKERQIAENREMERFLEELIADKEKFKCAFRTSSGSVYFVIPSGEVWRIKKNPQGYESTPIHTRIMFTDEATTEKITASVRQLKPTAALVGMAIPKAPFRPGVTPIEFGTVSEESEVVFEETAAMIRFLGTREGGDLNDEEIEGFHFGHPVSEVIHSA